MTSIVATDSLLVVDVGSVNTRAMLFDVVGDRYRFLAEGQAPTTAGAPFRDVSEGVHMALDQLQALTERKLVDEKQRLILPSLADGSGVDTFAATISAGPALKIVTVGLLEDVSLDSVRRLASTTYCGKIETISLNDRRKPEARIDAILRLRPDMILVAGGTEGGASQSVAKLLEIVGLACYLMPAEQRPELLYAGNSALQEEVKSVLSAMANLHFAPNVRPALEMEQLDAAQNQIAHLYSQVRTRQLAGVRELDTLARGGLLPTSAAFGRMIRFLSKAHGSRKGVLGLDVGASATTVAAAFSGDLVMGVYPQLGLGSGLAGMLNQVPLAEIMRWIPLELSEDSLREYIYNKSLFPATIPGTGEELAIEAALARLAIQNAIRLVSAGFPPSAAASANGLLPWFEPVVATGSVLTRAPNPAQALLMLLDGLQPTGATTFILDQNHITSALGVAAAVNPVISVQVLDSTSFLHLGTVISPVGHARLNTPVLRVKMTNDEDGHETNLDVKQGMLEVIPLTFGQTARLQLQPLHRYDIGMGAPGRGGGLRVVGGALGVVIDARGRPLRLPDDPGRRREQIKKWLWMLGA